MLACADDARRVPERDEANNCRASARLTYVMAAANPIHVTPVVDEARRASAIIGPEGGELTATAADGTRFVLRVPADALLLSTPISMTPVARIDGFRLGTMAGAVELGPDGVTFSGAATLTIEPATPVLLDGQRTFGYRAGGRDLHLELVDPATQAITIPVTHFSAVGVAYATLEQVRTLARRTPLDAEAAIKNEVATLLTTRRVDLLLGRAEDDGDPRAGTSVANAAVAQWAAVVEPLLQRAVRDGTYFEAAYAHYLSLLRTQQVLGVDDFVGAAAERLLRAAVHEAMKGVYDRCEQTRTLANVMRALYRSSAALKLELDELVDVSRLSRCAHFDLTYEATTTEAQFDGRQRFTAHTRTVLPVRVQPLGGGWMLSASAPVVYTDYSMHVEFQGQACQDSYEVRHREPMSALVGVFVDIFGGYQQADLRPHITIEFFPGNPVEKYTGVCPGDDSSFAVWAFAQPFWKVHEAERVRGTTATGKDEVGNPIPPWEDAQQLYRIEKWEGVGAAGIAGRKRYSVTVQNHVAASRGLATVTEDSLFELLY